MQLLQFRDSLHRITIDQLRDESEILFVGHPDNRDKISNNQDDVLSNLSPGDSPHPTEHRAEQNSE